MVRSVGMRNSTANEFQSTVQGYNTVNTESANIQIKNGKTRYALYPVWILNTTWQGQKYMFAMNGQTGKFVGNLPMDKSSFRKYFALAAAIGFAAVYGAALLIHYLI